MSGCSAAGVAQQTSSDSSTVPFGLGAPDSWNATLLSQQTFVAASPVSRLTIPG